MFEGVIHRILVGYLGRYIKDFHKHQLKLSLWNEELFLENVELIPEALDFLRLPFSLKHGRIGRLTIQVSWKKIVWDYSNTVFVVLQDVFLCVSPRNVHEWDPEAVEKREFAGKKAKLAAAELEKLSRRVCENSTGKWFFSYIMAKILKSIQVSIKNFHVQFCGEQSFPVLFGVKFSSLLVKQSSKRSSEKELALQGDKLTETEGLAFVKCDIGAVIVYCHHCNADMINNAVKVNSDCNFFEVIKVDPMVHPFDIFLSITMNKVGKLLPQYSLKAELNELVVSVSEIQMLQILNLIDFFNTGHLREKYGRYRPWKSPLSSKVKGWQKLWWQYAQKSVLSDVQRKLNRTSWRCLGNRLIYRRKYINFYKRKLELLQKELSPDEVVLEELEIMEREHDVDEILTFRSTAESELEEVLVSTGANLRASESSTEKPLNEEKSSTSWLNWLSRGLLGAGGASDIGQFAGVVSDEVVKDIYEATEFHPDSILNLDVDSSDQTHYLALEFKIILVSVAIQNRKCNKKVADVIFSNATIECKFWDDVTSSIYTIKSVRLLHDEEIIFQVEQTLNNKVATEEIVSSGVQVSVSSNNEADILIKANLGELGSTFNFRFFIGLDEFFSALRNFKFFHQRVLQSLDGIEDTKTRLAWKAEYILSINKTLSWDLCIRHITVDIPFERTQNDQIDLVFSIGSLHFLSKHDDLRSDIYFKKPYDLNRVTDEKFIATCLLKFGEVNLHNLFSIDYEELELSLFQCGKKMLILEKCNVSMFVALPFIKDASILENLEMFILVQAMKVNIRASVFEAGQALYQYFISEMSKYEVLKSQPSLSHESSLERLTIFGLTVAANMKEVVVSVNLEEGRINSDIHISLDHLCLWYSNIKVEECYSWINSATFVTSSFRNENDRYVLISSGNKVTPGSSLENYVQYGCKPVNIDNLDGCFTFHYECYSCPSLVYQRFGVKLNDADFHCHPHIFGLIAGFYWDIASTFSFSFDEDGDNDGNNASYGLLHSRLFSDTEGVLNSLVTKFPKSFKLSERDFHSVTSLSSSGQPPSPKVSRRVFSAEIAIRGTKIHFHDNCCAIGTINLPHSDSSFYLYKSLLDFACTVDGMMITSSLSSSSLREAFWLPSSSYITPVMTLGIRKEIEDLPSVDFSIKVQHVCCIVPSELLAVLIGYFFLPEWSSGYARFKCCLEHSDQKELDISFSVEFLDSVLLLPLDHCNHNFLKITFLNLQFCLFSDADPTKALENIPSKNRVPVDKVCCSSDCFDVSVRNLVASFLTCGPQEQVSKFWQDIHKDSITFISSFSADVWVRDPSKNELVEAMECTCAMARILECQIVIADSSTISRMFSLRDVINQLLEVEIDCKSYAGDASLFFQKRHLKNSQELVSDTTVSYNEVKLSIDAFSIEFYDLDTVISRSDPVFVFYLGFILSAYIKNDRLLELDIRYPTLFLKSVRDSLALLKGFSNVCSSPVSFVHYSQCNGQAHEIELYLPSLDIFFDISAWFALYDVVNSYAVVVHDALKEYYESPSSSRSCSEESHAIHIVFPTLAMPCSTSITVHIPVQCIESPNCESNDMGKHELQHISSHNFLQFTALIRGVDFYALGEEMHAKATLEDLALFYGSHEKEMASTSPFIIISYLDVIADYARGEPVILNIEMCSKDVDILLSDQTLHFFIFSKFDFSDMNGSHSLSSGLDIKLNVQKVSLLISDESWSCGGPLLEAVLTECLVHVHFSQNYVKSTLKSSLLVNFKNIHKVAWEPFVEPWNLQTEIFWKHDSLALINNLMITEVQLLSTKQLDLNFTESSIECIARLINMFKLAWNSRNASCQAKAERFPKPSNGKFLEGPSAPYKLHNLTSLPLLYHLFYKKLSSAELKGLETQSWISVPPGAVIPLLMSDVQEDANFSNFGISSGRSSNFASHRLMSVQFDGMSYPSMCFSIDVVGKTYFEADFSKAPSQSENCSGQEQLGSDINNSFLFPVVVDVSVEHYSKVVRLYSTVILRNLTRMPLLLRFDIPFGVQPKVLDPLYPEEEYPVPLHLAEVGRMRCRPCGNSYLWSELHDLSSIISPDIFGCQRPFVCYPSLPSNHPFRCCVSVEKLRLFPSFSSSKRGDGLRRSGSTDQILVDNAKERYGFQVKFYTPLIISSYLPCVSSFTIKSGGVMETVIPKEVEISLHHVEPAHDVDIELSVPGYKALCIKFPRVESFRNLNTGGPLTLVDNIILNREHSGVDSNDICISVEKIIHASSGSREFSVFAPLLLYNCTGLNLNILETLPNGSGSYWTVPSPYEWKDSDDFGAEKHSLHHLLSDQVSMPSSETVESMSYLVGNLDFAKNKKSVVFQMPAKHSSVHRKAALHTLQCGKRTELRGSGKYEKYENVKPIIFSASSPVKDLKIQIRKCPSGSKTDNGPHGLWSAPFLAVAPSASNAVLVPEASLSSSAYIVSVTCSALDGPLSGKSQAVVMQPRYLICNACNKNLLYKQKRSAVSTYLEVGRHASLMWTETFRELLITVCFDESGWQWSGSFLPDHLGDTQVKMRNYDGSHKMIRVEVVNPDTFLVGEMFNKSIGGNSGTNLIILSEDSIGFVPYRIDNLSKEKLRIYQQRCESSDTVIPPYSCVPYSWDEPYYPHRLVVEVPGDRIVGSYDLDNQKDAIPVHLQPTAEKSERTLLISVHAEGAIKVLRIMDLNFHYLNNQNSFNSPLSTAADSKSYETSNVRFLAFLRSIGMSIMSDSPQDLVFACAKGICLDMLQNMEQHKVSLRISSIQIDNQLSGTTYPVVLFFNDHDSGSAPTDTDHKLDPKIKLLSCASDNPPAILLDVATLRTNEISLLSFEYIILRVASFHLEVDQNFAWNLLDFAKSVSLRLQNQSLILAGFIDKTDEDTRENQMVTNSNPAFSTIFSAKTSLPAVVPVGAPWQNLCQSAGRNAKIYVQTLYVAPIEFSLSFSSSPWCHRNNGPSLGSFSFLHRGLMALADVEGAQIQLKQFTLSHKISGLDSLQNLLARHYYRQLLHEMYKVFGSAGVIGNPIGFARSMSHGIRDFMTVPTKTLFQSPSGLLIGMAQGTTSLVSNTVYAFSDATTQFTKAAQKGIVALAPNDRPTSTDHEGPSLQSKGVVHEVLEGLTGLLQYPVKEVEKHGLPGVVSGVALGLTGLLAKPAASILEVAGKTAQSIKNKSMIYHKGSKPSRMRFPRPLRRSSPLKVYSWDEAIGLLILRSSEDGAKQREDLLLCKALKEAGKYVVVTERVMLIAVCPDLVDLGKAEFRGVQVDLKCLYEAEIWLDCLIHVEAMDAAVHFVGSTSERPNQRKSNIGGNDVPLFHTDLELISASDADHLVRVVMFAIEEGKARGLGSSLVLHRYTLSV